MTLFSYRPRERKKLACTCAPVLCRIIAASALVVFPCFAETASPNAQTGPLEIPPVTVTAPPASPSLTVPSPDEAREIIQRTPGGVDLVPAEEFHETRALTLKDVLDYVPGVFAQPKWGEDARLSIRGSGIARNFHLRGVRLLQDGIPTVKADGSGDFQELDPLAARYVEVYRGANALRYGSTMLGGAINLISPTGHDADAVFARAELGSFDFRRVQVGSGMAIGNWDYFLTPSYVASDGFRDHSDQSSLKLNGNLGYRFSADVETRFYVNYSDIDQEIPGSVTREAALSRPRRAAAGNVALDYQRNIDSFRIANKTTIDLGSVSLDVGGFFVDKQLDHPIFQVLDNHFQDYGGFARATGEMQTFGNLNRFTLGVNVHAGTNDNKRYVNNAGNRGALTYHTDERALNVDIYGENQHFLLPTFALVTGAQVGYSEREADDRFLADGDDSGSKDFAFFNPKFGMLWEPSAEWQVFGNVSRSTEIPTLTDLNTATIGFTDVEPQKAWTMEIGTRGRLEDIGWDFSLYRSWIRDEIQLFENPPGSGFSSAVNADETIHQGIELGFDATVVKGIIADGAESDRLWLRQAYTFSDFFFDDDPVFGDNEIPGIPRHYYRAELLYEHPAGFYLGPNVEWIPEAFYADNANTLKTNSYALLGFRAGFEFDGGSIFLDARNITDEKYIASTSVIPVASPTSALFEPGNGASVYVGVRIRW